MIANHSYFLGINFGACKFRTLMNINGHIIHIFYTQLINVAFFYM